MYLATPFKTAYEKGIRNICNYNSVFEDHTIIVLSRNYFCDAFIASYLNDHKPGGFIAMNICLVNKIFKYFSINI